MARSSRLDQLDYHLVQALQQCSRQSSAVLARQLGANERTVRKRIERLEQMGAVRFVALVNPAFFGYALTADIFLQVVPQFESAVLEQLTRMPDVVYLALGDQQRSLSVQIRCKDVESLRTFIRKTLPSIEGVSICGYTLVPHIIRSPDSWLPGVEDFISD